MRLGHLADYEDLNSRNQKSAANGYSILVLPLAARVLFIECPPKSSVFQFNGKAAATMEGNEYNSAGPKVTDSRSWFSSARISNSLQSSLISTGALSGTA